MGRNRLFTGWAIPAWIVLAIEAAVIIRKLFGWWDEAEFVYGKRGVVIDFLLSPHGQLILIVACVGFLFYSSRKKESDLSVIPPVIDNGDDRIPYVEIRKLANAKGWNLNESVASNNYALVLEDAMQEAAFYGRLRVWGRSCETSMGSNPLKPIRSQHFEYFKFHYGYLTRDDVENASTYTWKPETGKNKNSFGLENYCDLYVSKSDIKRLLRRVRPSDGSV